ncbi:MAG: chorismate mutase [Candidatus Pelagibacter sp.]
MVNKNIINIRLKLDKLDDALLQLIKKRANLVDQVLKNKNFKKDIIDRKRISVILRTIYKKSKKKKIDTLITKRIWSSMIKAFIDYEFRKFKKK